MVREDVTLALAQWAVSADTDGLAPVAGQARRALTNYLGCAVGGTREPASVHLRAWADELSGPRRANVAGSALRLDAAHAALVNCLQSSIQTFDDTHLSSVIHPTGPVAAALVALLQHRADIECDGAAFLAAMSVGIEISCRVAHVLTSPPAHPHVGLFMTGLTGGVGAAAACARLLGLDALRVAWAMGTAASQAGGLRASHTTMSGGLVPALGARAGLEAALLAQRGFDGRPGALEHANGLFAVLAPGSDPQRALAGLGREFELTQLSFKPYPCGVVIHPSIDGCLEIVPRLARADVQQVRLTVHPLTLQLTGTRHPASALACNASVFHWAAAALVRGRAGLDESDERALHDPAIAALRGRIEAHADASLALDEAHVHATTADGRTWHAHVQHARGSRDRPLSDAELADKVQTLCEPLLGTAGAHRLLHWCASLPGARPGWPAELADLLTPST